MTLTRHNILDLIGSGKYHSCVFTTFSFDFTFFELKVMRAMRTAGVKNILVLLDAKILDRLAQHSMGAEFAYASGYSVYPIFAEGVFHPKMCLLFGKNEGVLLLGSGNLTAAGLGNNDELWNAIRLNDISSQNAGLFSDAWHYIQQFTEDIKGINAEKLQWIKNFTPWLKDLPQPVESVFHQLEGGTSASFLTNTQESILKTTIRLIGQRKVKSISTISPFYDNQGKVLEILHRNFHEADINCVIEDRTGTAPINMSKNVADHCSFYSWEDIFPDIKTVNRLHAKLIHFNTSDGEFLLMGSANVTAAAMGSSDSIPINHEANMLLFRQKGNWLKDLGINLRSNQSKPLASFTSLGKNHDLQDLLERFTTRVKVLSAEIENAKLKIYLYREVEGVFEIELVEGDGIVIFNITVEDLVVETEIPLPNLKGLPHLLRIVDEKGEEVARQFIQFPESQYKYCPDPRYEKAQLAMAGLGITTDLTDLLELIDFEDEEIKLSSGGPSTVSSKVESEPKGQTLTYDEFNKTGNDWLLSQRMEVRSGIVQMAEFLSLLGKQLPESQPNLICSDLMAADTDWDSQSEEDYLLPNIQVDEQETKTRALKEEKSLHRYLNKLLKHLESRLEPFKDAASPYQINLDHYTLKDLSNLIIALHVAMHYGSKSYTEEKQGVNHTHYFLGISGDQDTIDNLKAFCIHIIGGYLLLLTPEAQNYNEESALSKLSKFKDLAFKRILFLVCSLPWKEDEFEFRDLLFLNSWLYLAPFNGDSTDLGKELKKTFEDLSARFKLPIKDNCTTTYDLLVVKYGQKLSSFQRSRILPPAARKKIEIGITKIGDLLYSSKLGLCSLHSKKGNLDQTSIALARPGFFQPNEDYPFVFKYTLPTRSQVLPF